MPTGVAPPQSEIAMLETDSPPIFVCGLARVEPIGPNVPLVVFGNYLFEHRVSLCVTAPKEAIGLAIELAT